MKFLAYCILMLSFMAHAQVITQTTVSIGPEVKQPKPREFPKRQCMEKFGVTACGYHCLASNTGIQCAQQPDQQCVMNASGEIACGYGCAQSLDKIRCAPLRGQSCIADRFGHVACGYDCKAGLYVLGCANAKGDNCVLSSTGSIKCGLQCRNDNGQVICKQQR